MQRIGAGELKGRVLMPLPSGVSGLRPTGARVRGAIFDRLQAEVVGARVLDLFAGSGALTFEALSRGASAAVLLDDSRAVIAHLRKQAEALGVAARCTTVHIDALRYLREPQPGERFDLVFVDPPFATPEVFDPILAALVEERRLNPDAIVVCESERVRGKRHPITWPAALCPVLSRAYGQAHVDILQHESQAPP